MQKPCTLSDSRTKLCFLHKNHLACQHGFKRITESLFKQHLETRSDLHQAELLSSVSHHRVFYVSFKTASECMSTPKLNNVSPETWRFVRWMTSSSVLFLQLCPDTPDIHQRSDKLFECFRIPPQAFSVPGSPKTARLKRIRRTYDPLCFVCGSEESERLD